MLAYPSAFVNFVFVFLPVFVGVSGLLASSSSKSGNLSHKENLEIYHCVVPWIPSP